MQEAPSSPRLAKVPARRKVKKLKEVNTRTLRAAIPGNNVLPLDPAALVTAVMHRISGNWYGSKTIASALLAAREEDDLEAPKKRVERLLGFVARGDIDLCIKPDAFYLWGSSGPVIEFAELPPPLRSAILMLIPWSDVDRKIFDLAQMSTTESFEVSKCRWNTLINDVLSRSCIYRAIVDTLISCASTVSQAPPSESHAFPLKQQQQQQQQQKPQRPQSLLDPVTRQRTVRAISDHLGSITESNAIGKDVSVELRCDLTQLSADLFTENSDRIDYRPPSMRQ